MQALMQDIATSRISSRKNAQSKRKQYEKRSILSITYYDRITEFFRINNILKQPDVRSLFPDIPNAKFYALPNIRFDYPKPISGIVFNYRQCLTNVTKHNLAEYFEPNQCECSDSPYMDPDHKHIITGDLKLVNDDYLVNILAKGPKFRPQLQANKYDILDFLRNN